MVRVFSKHNSNNRASIQFDKNLRFHEMARLINNTNTTVHKRNKKIYYKTLDPKFDQLAYCNVTDQIKYYYYYLGYKKVDCKTGKSAYIRKVDDQNFF
jgi:hypothetical protein